MTPLRQRMLEDMQVRNLSPHTQQSYVQRVSQFARHFGKSPERLGLEEIRAYQVYLIKEKRLAAKSISTAVSALRFLYTITLKKDWLGTHLSLDKDAPVSRPVAAPTDGAIVAIPHLGGLHQRYERRAA